VLSLSASAEQITSANDIQVNPLETVHTIIYDNSTTPNYWYPPGSFIEVLDYGSSLGGTVTKFTFAYFTELKKPGSVTVRFYEGTDSNTCTGSFLAGWVFSGLDGVRVGGAAFVYDFNIPSEEEFFLPSGAFGYSYEFDYKKLGSRETGAWVASGGAGNEDSFWEDCVLSWFGGDPWAGFYMRIYKTQEVQGDIRIEPLVLDFNCGSEDLEPLTSRENNSYNPAPGEKLIDAESIMQTFAAGEKKVKVIVNLLEPEQLRAGTNWRSKKSLRALQQEIAKRQEQVLRKKEFKLRHRFKNQAGFSAEVTRAELERLLNHPMVASIEPVRILKAHLNQGIPLMNALGYRSSYNGAGIAIAICDTGIDYTHPKLGGGGFPNNKVIGGYDFGNDDANPMPVGEPHGTSCAGIAAGDLGAVGDYIGGVAHNAKLYALKISPDNSGSASTDAMVAAWDWCITHQNDDPNNPIMIISTSFGGGRFFSTCDSDTPAMTTAADNAVAAGITVLASSGNDGWCDSMGWPACISNVISVGAVYDAAFGTYYPCVDAGSCATKYAGGCSTGWYAIDDTAADMVASYSNTATFLDILAPSNQAYTTDIAGSGGYSTGDYTSSFGGTSAACPYVAGTVASLQSAAKELLGRYLTPAEVREKLTAMGDYITDGKIAITKPRVNLGQVIDNLAFSGQTFTIYNDGQGTLTVSSVTAEAGSDWLLFEPTGPFTIGASGYQEIYVDVDCNSCGVGDRLLVFSDDPNESPYPNGVFVNVAAWPGDLDNDCRAAMSDLQLLTEYWLQPSYFDALLYEDGKTDFKDYSILAEHWLQER
jgi:subtilisin family serine protease